MVITAAERLEGVRVDTIRPHTGLLEAHRELELIDHIAAAGDRTAKLQVLADEAPACCGWAGAPSCGPPSRGLQRHRRQPGRTGDAGRDSAPWLPIDAGPGARRHRRLGAAGMAGHGHHAGRGAAGRPAHRGGARPAGRTVIPAVGGSPAGLSGRHRGDDPALSITTRALHLRNLIVGDLGGPSRAAAGIRPRRGSAPPVRRPCRTSSPAHRRRRRRTSSSTPIRRPCRRAMTMASLASSRENPVNEPVTTIDSPAACADTRRHVRRPSAPRQPATCRRSRGASRR